MRTDTQIAELTVPLIELGDEDRMALLRPFGCTSLEAVGVEMMISITGTRLHLRTTGETEREFTVDILALADAALRAIDAQMSAEALE